MSSSKLALVSYSDSDTDSDQDTNTAGASCIARNTDLSISPIRRDTPHQTSKGDRRSIEKEDCVYPPLKKRRKDRKPVTSSRNNEHEHSVAGDVRIQAENEHSTQLMERDSSLVETDTLALPSAILDMFKEGTSMSLHAV